MDGEDISGVEFEHEIDTGAKVDLDGEWVAWLQDQPVPDCVEGVDESVRHDGTALA